tara:strand:- start:307 stop:1152 length:846 start_codon:yes stop_codon:yes gene_type:complete
MIRIYSCLLFSFIFSSNPINNFIIGFWPEYDHPGILVSIQIESNVEQLPFDFNIDVPRNAKMAIETVINNGDRTNNILDIKSSNKDSSSYINTVINSQKYLLQYYFNPFEAESDYREMHYNLNTNVDLFNFYVVIQKHLGALEFQTNLKELETIEDNYSVTYFRKKIPQLLSSDSLYIEISYKNPSNITTMDLLNQNLEKSIEKDEFKNSSLEVDGKNRYYKNKIYILLILSITTILIMILYVIYNRQDNNGIEFLACKKCNKIIKKSDSFCSFCGGKNVS